MAKKQSKKSADASGDPLSRLEKFDPAAKNAPPETTAKEQQNSTPVSPLGPPTPISLPYANPITNQLQHAEQQVQGLQQELSARAASIREQERRIYELETAVKQATQENESLKKEREIRLALEREMAALEVEVRQVRQATEELARERAARLEIERKIATLEVRAERADAVAEQLVEEREARVRLEREKATLEVQVASLQKLETLLSEERQARMNAQSRAASAEAQLARIQGEMAQQDSGNSSFLGKIRGR